MNKEKIMFWLVLIPAAFLGDTFRRFNIPEPFGDFLAWYLGSYDREKEFFRKVRE